MWRAISNPDVLIYLDAELSTIQERQLGPWTESHLEQLHHRLRHARAHCDFYLATDGLTEDEVGRLIVEFLEGRGFAPPQST
jgi:hypothetical protein